MHSLELQLYYGLTGTCTLAHWAMLPRGLFLNLQASSLWFSCVLYQWISLFLLIQSHKDEVHALAVHPHLTQFISASLDSSVSLWDAETHHVIWTVELEVSFSVMYCCSTKFNQCMCLQKWVKPIWVGKQTCQETANFIVKLKCLIKCKIQMLILILLIYSVWWKKVLAWV